MSLKYEHNANNKIANYKTVNQLKFKDNQIVSINTLYVFAFSRLRHVEFNPLKQVVTICTT
jgi:hypothetical protein